MNCNKSLYNVDIDSLYAIPFPFATFEQTTGQSGNMTAGIWYVVKPVSGGSPLNIWDNINVQGGISVSTQGIISFTQSGRYTAVLQASIGGSTEAGRVRYALIDVNNSTRIWIDATHDVQAGSTRTQDVGVYNVAAGDQFELRAVVEDVWQVAFQAFIPFNRFTIYLSA